jgi:hypothetical protein
MRRFLQSLLAVVLTLTVASPAFADATFFLGSTATPSARVAKGAAIGFGLLIIGFEFEYSDTGEDESEVAPELRTGMGNVLLQTPFPIARMQFYFTAGGGGYRESLGPRQETHFGANTGGGVKVSLLGPLRARFDYRLFTLSGSPVHSRVQRVYAGVNLAF